MANLQIIFGNSNYSRIPDISEETAREIMDKISTGQPVEIKSNNCTTLIISANVLSVILD